MQADRRAPVELPEQDFIRFARARIRGALMDELRTMTHSARRGRYRPSPLAFSFATRNGANQSLRYQGPSPEEEAMHRQAMAERGRRFDALPERWRAVLLRIMAGERGADIAADFGVHPVRISQLTRQAALRVLGDD